MPQTKKKKKRRKKLLLFFLIFFIFIIIGLYKGLQVTDYTITSDKLPEAFDGYKICQISDLHCSYFGEHQEELIDKIKEFEPDIIVLTGDIIDFKNRDYDCVEELLKGIVNIAPVYSVTGNHEYVEYEVLTTMRSLYNQYGITELENDGITITKDTESIFLYGLRFTGSYYNDYSIDEILEHKLPKADKETYSILLNHTGNQFDPISEYGYDLVLSGHTHGGIVRLPFIGGLLANDRSFFPKYDGGLFEKNGSTMILSRGLGESNPIPRFYNRRELVFITLRNR